LYILLFYTALFIGVIPLVVLFRKKKAFVHREPVVPFIWLTALATLYEFIGTMILKINVNYWFQLYSLLEFAALYYFFYRLLGHRYSLIYKALPVLFVIFYIISFFFWSDTGTGTLISLALNKTILSVFILFSGYLWFRNLFEKMDVMNLWKYDSFYFISGFLIYYSVTFLLFLFSELIYNNSVYFNDFWLVNILAVLILRILLITGVWKMKKSLR